MGFLLRPCNQICFYLVEEFLSFDLGGHMWKLVKNWFQKCIFCGKFCGELAHLESAYSLIRGSNDLGKGWWGHLGTFMVGIFNKIWNFSRNRVMGSQPIWIELGKFLWEILAGKSCGEILQEILVGNSCKKFW